VTVLAIGRRAAVCLVRFGMEAMPICLLLVRVALRTLHFLRRGLMRLRLHIVVAIDAPQDFTMHGMLEPLRIDPQADYLSPYLLGQRSILMAREALLILRLVRRPCG